MEKLERNLIDNIIESEVKLGCVNTSITFYYPQSSFIELLDCTVDELSMKLAEFSKNEKGRLGDILIEELKDEKGRYAVIIPAEGFDWVRKNFKPSDFTKDFIQEIRKPHNTLDGIEEFFFRYSSDVTINKVNASEWAFSFNDEEIDPYVYHVEQNVFGLEYHRFTRESYNKIIGE